MSVIDFHITDAAADQLHRHMATSSRSDLVATVQWSEGGESWRTDESGNRVEVKALPPEWTVGFYDRSCIEGETIHRINEIDIVFGQGRISERLNGKVLDYVKGKYVVLDMQQP